MDTKEHAKRWVTGMAKGKMMAEALVVGERFHGSMITADFFFQRGSPECDGFEYGFYNNLPFNIMANGDGYITNIVRV